MDKKYLGLNKELSLHYFSDSVMAIDRLGKLNKFDEVQTDIVEMIDGKTTVKEIFDKMIKKYEVDESELKETIEIMSEFVQNTIEDNVFEISEKEINQDIKITGERGAYYPYTLNIELTEACNLRCSHCYQEATTKGSYISMEDINKIANSIKGKVKRVVFTGGEPTIHPNINEIVKIFDEAVDTVNMITNGTNIDKLDKETIDKIKMFQVSIYGRDEKEYLDITKVKSYESFKVGIKRLKERKARVVGTVVLNNTRVETMKAYADLCVENEIPALRFGTPIQVGRAIEEAETWGITGKDHENMEDKVSRLSKEYEGKVMILDWKDEHKMKYDDDYETERGLPCGAGGTSITITANGAFKVCQMLPKEFFEASSVDYIEETFKGKRYFDLDSQMRNYKKHLEELGIPLASACSRLEEY